jgi:hypothetical protein
VAEWSKAAALTSSGYMHLLEQFMHVDVKYVDMFCMLFVVQICSVFVVYMNMHTGVPRS